MSLLTCDPFAVARQLGVERPKGSQCSGPPATKRHHWTMRMRIGGAEPVMAWECAHCLLEKSRWNELFLTEAECRLQEECSLDQHKNHCRSARPEMRPRRQATAGPRAIRR